MTAAAQVAVVVVSYNTRDDLRLCLRSLASVSLPLEVVVVDNASTDGSAAAAREELPHATVLESPRTWASPPPAIEAGGRRQHPVCSS